MLLACPSASSNCYAAVQHRSRAGVIRYDFKTLQLFVAACELSSLSRAAERLGLAPSAASRRIQMLEHDAKMTLLERLPHGVRPTASGQTLLRFARDIMHLADRADQVLVEHEQGVRGYVRVASSSSVLLCRLASDLSRFVAQHPGIEIDLEERATEATLDLLRSRQVDLGAVVTAIDTQPFEVFPFGADKLVLGVPRDHRLAESASVRFADFAAENLVTLGYGTAVRRALSEQARRHGGALSIRVQANSFEVMALMASQGLGIAVLPEAALRPMMTAYGLVAVTIDEEWAKRDFAICVRHVHDLAAPARRLLAFLLETQAIVVFRNLTCRNSSSGTRHCLLNSRLAAVRLRRTSDTMGGSDARRRVDRSAEVRPVERQQGRRTV